MQAVQFFMFGLLVVWLTGTGKLAAFINALKTAPTSTGNPNNPNPSNPNPSPPSGTPSTPGTVYIGPDGNTYVIGPDGNPLKIMG